jgi:hypothetical protein
MDKKHTTSGFAGSAKWLPYLRLLVIRVNPRDPRLKLRFDVFLLTFEVRRFPFDVSFVFLFRSNKRLQENA